MRKNWFARKWCGVSRFFGHDWYYQDVIDGGHSVKVCQRCGELRWATTVEHSRAWHDKFFGA